MDPIFNELSLVPAPAVSVDERLTELARILKTLVGLGAERVLRSHKEALDQPLDGATTLRVWVNAGGALREERRYLRSLLGKAPFVEDLQAHREQEKHSLYELRHGNDRAHGAGVAYLFGGPSVSLRGDARFEVDPLTLSLLTLDEHGNAVSELVEVVNLATLLHVEARRELLRERVLREVRSGAELWRRRADLFRSLDFCERTRRQVEALVGTEAHFYEVCRHLAAIDDALSVWTEGELDPPRTQWSNESRVTMSHDVYGPQRDVLCPDGETRRFKAHTKIRINNKRIYFWPVAETRRAYIGYVGDHLQTVSYTT